MTVYKSGRSELQIKYNKPAFKQLERERIEANAKSQIKRLVFVI